MSRAVGTADGKEKQQSQECQERLEQQIKELIPSKMKQKSLL